MPHVRGVITALLTPFTRDGRLDLRRLRGLVAYQISSGVDGFFVCGSTGVFPLLSLEERMRVVEAVTGEAGGRAAVIAHVGCPDTKSTVMLAKHAERAGATAVACVTPYYYKFSLDSLIEYYRAVSAAVGIPLYVYNIPECTGFNVTPAILGELSRRGGVRGIKDSSRDFAQLVTFVDMFRGSFDVLTGSESHFYAALLHGASGMVSAVSNVFPELCVGLYKAFLAGDLSRARELQSRLCSIRNSLPQPVVPALHEMLRVRGVDGGYPRPPFTNLSRREREGIRRLFDEIPR
jgi:4-hydroxy-tetrahydrodipicolinate synthase